MKLYGIANCSTVKAARTWLDAHGHRYEFIDYKKMPPPPELLAQWSRILGWEAMLNRRGTTWRTLDAAVQAKVKDEKSAIAVMLAKPSIIKRPILESGKALLIGFDEDQYANRLRA